MANCYGRVSDHWKACFNREYPLSEAEHEKVMTAVMKLPLEIIDPGIPFGDLAQIDKLLACFGLAAFVAGFNNVMTVTAAPVHENRHPDFRAQCHEWTINAATAGSLAFLNTLPG